MKQAVERVSLCLHCPLLEIDPAIVATVWTVLSLANPAMVVHEVGTELIRLVVNWVQTPSDYHVLFANTIPAKWALLHQLVLSQHGHDPKQYMTYIKEGDLQEWCLYITPSLWHKNHCEAIQVGQEALGARGQ